MLQHDFQGGIIILIIIMTAIIITARLSPMCDYLFVYRRCCLVTFTAPTLANLGRSFCRFAVRFPALSDYTKLVSRRD